MTATRDTRIAALALACEDIAYELRRPLWRAGVRERKIARAEHYDRRAARLWALVERCPTLWDLDQHRARS